MADRPSRLVTGTFVIYETDGIDGGTLPDATPVVGLIVQFTPQQKHTTEVAPERMAFHAPIIGITDSDGVLRSPEGGVGLRVPISMPEGFSYSVRVIPPDGSRATPYTFNTIIPTGSGAWDISTLPELNISMPSLGTVRVQLEDPRVVDPKYQGWWLHSTIGDPDPGTYTGTGILYLIT